MIQTTYSDAYARLGHLIEEVAVHREVVIIERGGKEPVAMVPASELMQLMKNVQPLRSPQALQRRLAELGRTPVYDPPSQSPDELRRSLISR
ncbi:MAG TPA: type II toxin-antitoxin system Phd/YefM family antitoxin [Anaerolineaceae bacterium]